MHSCCVVPLLFLARRERGNKENGCLVVNERERESAPAGEERSESVKPIS